MDYFKVKDDFINRNGIFSGIVLKNTSQEALCEKESRNPKYNWYSAIDPLLEET